MRGKLVVQETITGNLLFRCTAVARYARLLQSSFLLLECEPHFAVAVATDSNKMDSAVKQKVERKKCKECELKPSFSAGSTVWSCLGILSVQRLPDLSMVSG